jgi:polyisoprenoid-binding protein YceI
LAVVVCATAAQDAAGQTRWKIDSKSSIAWWQVDPHLAHLWATTCTQEPGWRPGSDRTGGWSYDPSLKMPKAGHANVVDTIPMPAFPRKGQAEPICTESVSGGVTVQDQATWGGVQGVVLVKGADLQTGNSMRDAFARRAVLETDRYTHIKFNIDSVTNVQQGDTLRGTFYGMLTLVGAERPFSSLAKAWYEGENLRVLAHFKIPAIAMIDEFGVSKYALGLGVRTGIWRFIFVGVDLLLEKE